jgi:hypothetical protein
MPDYGEPYFNHTISKLVQLDITDEDNQLVPPWKMYDALRPGTLVLANCSLHCFLMTDTKVQQKVSVVIYCAIQFRNGDHTSYIKSTSIITKKNDL